MTRTHGWWRAVLTGTALVGLLAVLGLATAWHVQGGRWYDVSTPSMGQTLPVGTLVVTRATTVADLEVGDVITFRTPTSGEIYTHRVVAIDASGVQTQGDINAVPDATRTTEPNLIGRVVWHAEGLGWLLRGVPLLVVGAGLVVLLTTRVRQRSRRTAWRRTGTAVVVALVSWWLRPWVGMVRLGQSDPPAGQDGVVMQVVSTGLLPIRVSEVDGPARAVLSNGQVGDLHLTAGAERGAFDLTSAIHLEWWGWVVLALCCLSPLLVNLVLGLPEDPGGGGPGRHVDAVPDLPLDRPEDERGDHPMAAAAA